MESGKIRELLLSNAYPFNGEFCSENEQGVPTLNFKTAFGINRMEYISTRITCSLIENGKLPLDEIPQKAIDIAIDLINKIYE